MQVNSNVRRNRMRRIVGKSDKVIKEVL